MTKKEKWYEEHRAHQVKILKMCEPIMAIINKSSNEVRNTSYN